MPSANKVTLAQLCDRYLETQQHLKKNTRDDKARIIRRMKALWPEGGNQSRDEVRVWHVQARLLDQGGQSNANSLNSYIEVVRSVFTLAVRDQLLADSPAEGLTYRKRKRPIHNAPSAEERRAVVAEIRKR